MKFYKQIIIILVIFFKTETVFSENNLFSVNNILLEKKDKISNKQLANKAIKKGFDQLKAKILLEEDQDKLSDLNFTSIRQLVTYYQISENLSQEQNIELVNFNITFDKEKIHNLFYERNISYSDIQDKELYILPITIKNNNIFVFNENYFYEYWNKVFLDDLIEFILPLENIEIIQKIQNNKNNLINLNLNNLFQEYSEKNLALVLIDVSQSGNEIIYIKANIQGKNISKNLILKKKQEKKDFYKKVIVDTKLELINLVKSKNLIDIRTPSFLNVKLELNNKNSLVELNSRIKNIKLIENVYVNEFNKDNMFLKIKYLGKLDKIINLLKKEKINLKLVSDQWVIKSL